MAHHQLIILLFCGKLRGKPQRIEVLHRPRRKDKLAVLRSNSLGTLTLIGRLHIRQLDGKVIDKSLAHLAHLLTTEVGMVVAHQCRLQGDGTIATLATTEASPALSVRTLLRSLVNNERGIVVIVERTQIADTTITFRQSYRLVSVGTHHFYERDIAQYVQALLSHFALSFRSSLRNGSSMAR